MGRRLGPKRYLKANRHTKRCLPTLLLENSSSSRGEAPLPHRHQNGENEDSGPRPERAGKPGLPQPAPHPRPPPRVLRMAERDYRVKPYGLSRNIKHALVPWPRNSTPGGMSAHAHTLVRPRMFIPAFFVISPNRERSTPTNKKTRFIHKT